MASLISRVCFRLTGKQVNPHLIRDMIVTHLRSTDTSERELEALAMYMGHSLNMQRQFYDKRTQSQKIQPAADLIRRLLESV